MKGWAGLKKFARNGAFSNAGLLIGCDFDGTIAPFVRKPSQAKLPKEMRRVIARLAQKPGVRVAILSGRGLQDVKNKMGLKGVIYCGNHGLEMERNGIVWIHPEARMISRLIPALVINIQKGIAGFRGAELEDKIYSLSLHYRRVSRPRDVLRLESLLNSWVRPHRHYLRIVRGKKLFDVRPTFEWNKGHALLDIIQSLEGMSHTCFIGDDQTDEEAFETLGRRALTIRVGPALKSKAHFILEHRGYVRRFLNLIAERDSH